VHACARGGERGGLVSRIRIGVNQFSFHRYYGEILRHESDPEVRWDLNDFLTQVEPYDPDVISLQTIYLQDDEIHGGKLQEASERFKETILEWGHPDGLQMGKSQEAEADASRWIRLAQELEMGIMRIVAGFPTYRGEEPVEDQFRRLIPILQRLCDRASETQLQLALENHADFTPVELKRLIGMVERENLGAAFDTGNCVRLGVEILEGTRAIAKLTRMVHLKDIVQLPESVGNPLGVWPSAVFGQGATDVRGSLDVLVASGFSGPVLVELSAVHPFGGDERDAVAACVDWLTSYKKTDGRD
jgi:sugar phosphate isomerase/epimerase